MQTTKRPPYGSSRTTGRALILYGVQKKNALSLIHIFIGNAVANASLPLVLVAFIVAALVRISVGSATVAMTMAAVSYTHLPEKFSGKWAFAPTRSWLPA